MESVIDPRKRKFLYFLIRLVEFICNRVPSYQEIFSDERKNVWYRLSRTSLDAILCRIIRHTPCSVLSSAFNEGLLTAHTGIFYVVGSAIRRSPRRRARCLIPFLDLFEREFLFVFDFTILQIYFKINGQIFNYTISKYSR